jgi:hypothetical protein
MNSEDKTTTDYLTPSTITFPASTLTVPIKSYFTTNTSTERSYYEASHKLADDGTSSGITKL